MFTSHSSGVSRRWLLTESQLKCESFCRGLDRQHLRRDTLSLPGAAQCNAFGWFFTAIGYRSGCHGQFVEFLQIALDRAAVSR